MIDFLVDAAVMGCGSYIMLGIMALVMLFILALCFELHPLLGGFMTVIFLLLGAAAVRDQNKKKLSKEAEDPDPAESEQKKELGCTTQAVILFLVLLVVGVLGFLAYLGQIF